MKKTACRFFGRRFFNGMRDGVGSRQMKESPIFCAVGRGFLFKGQDVISQHLRCLRAGREPLRRGAARAAPKHDGGLFAGNAVVRAETPVAAAGSREHMPAIRNCQLPAPFEMVAAHVNQYSCI